MERLGRALERVNKKKGKKSGQSGEDGLVGQTRSVNFAKEESDMLLEAAREIQINTGRTDLNFTKHEMQQVYALFSAKSKGIIRTQDQLLNRLKTLKKEFNIFKDLSTKSGWSWDYENHVVVPPSREVLEEMIQKDWGRLKYFDTKKFPWYELMTRMCGGRMARGGNLFNSYGTQDTQQTQNMGQTHNSGTRSGTGSSDNPRDDEPVDNETEDTIQQPFPHSGDGTDTSFRHVAHSSECVTPASRSSGSQKRKNTDGSGEMSKGQKIQKRISAKSKGFEQINDTGAKLALVQEQFVEESRRFNQMREHKDQEFDKALEKMWELQLSPTQQLMIVQKIEETGFRKFFLRATNQQIWDWIAAFATQQSTYAPQQPAFAPQPIFPSQPGFNPQQGTSSLQPQQGNPFLNTTNLPDAFNFFSVNPRPSSQ